MAVFSCERVGTVFSVAQVFWHDNLGDHHLIAFSPGPFDALAADSKLVQNSRQSLDPQISEIDLGGAVELERDSAGGGAVMLAIDGELVVDPEADVLAVGFCRNVRRSASGLF